MFEALLRDRVATESRTNWCQKLLSNSPRSHDRSVAWSLDHAIARSLDRSIAPSLDARSLGRLLVRSLDHSAAQSLGRSTALVARAVACAVAGASGRSGAQALGRSDARSPTRWLLADSGCSKRHTHYAPRPAPRRANGHTKTRSYV